MDYSALHLNCLWSSIQSYPLHHSSYEACQTWKLLASFGLKPSEYLKNPFRKQLYGIHFNLYLCRNSTWPSAIPSLTYLDSSSTSKRTNLLRTHMLSCMYIRRMRMYFHGGHAGVIAKIELILTPSSTVTRLVPNGYCKVKSKLGFGNWAVFLISIAY